MKKTILSLLLLAPLAQAQYTIDWFTMDGGGGSGNNGAYALDGTLGQIDAFAGAAGSSTLLGGFWSVTSETLPLLRMFVEAQNLILAWPNPSPGFELQATPSLLPPAWSHVALPPVIVGDEKQVNWGLPVGAQFFRLQRP